jgi:hypothetical protein
MLDKPNWITSGLRIRKPFGLLALWFLGIHIIMSLLIFNQKYYGKFFIDKTANSSKLNAIGEFSFFFAILGSGFYFILGICSLPSVGMQMTSRSWQVSPWATEPNAYLVFYSFPSLHYTFRSVCVRSFGLDCSCVRHDPCSYHGC